MVAHRHSGVDPPAVEVLHAVLTAFLDDREWATGVLGELMLEDRKPVGIESRSRVRGEAPIIRRRSWIERLGRSEADLVLGRFMKATLPGSIPVARSRRRTGQSKVHSRNLAKECCWSTSRRNFKSEQGRASPLS